MTYPNKAIEAVCEILAEWRLSPADVRALAADLPGEMEAQPRCDECGLYTDDLLENDLCDDCNSEHVMAEAKLLLPLYLAEKHAGLLKSPEELADDLRLAGRGHLVR